MCSILLLPPSHAHLLPPSLYRLSITSNLKSQYHERVFMLNRAGASVLSAGTPLRKKKSLHYRVRKQTATAEVRLLYSEELLPSPPPSIRSVPTNKCNFSACNDTSTATTSNPPTLQPSSAGFQQKRTGSALASDVRSTDGEKRGWMMLQHVILRLFSEETEKSSSVPDAWLIRRLTLRLGD